MQVGLIADDLTGLTAVASEFERYGFSVGIALNAETASALADSCDIVGIDTNSRSLPSEDAAKAVRDAARALAKLEPDWIFKQGDSALHGQTAVEVTAVLEALGNKHILMAPACPSLERFTVGGVHRPVIDDPSSYVRVAELFSEYTSVTVADAVNPLPDTSGGPRVTVLDAQDDSALDAAVLSADQSGERLVAGSVGLAKALARHLWSGGTRNSHPVLILLGSFQERSRQQAAALLVTGTARQIDLPATIAADDVRSVANEVGQALRARQHVILSASLQKAGTPNGARYPFLDAALRLGIEQALSETTRAIIDDDRNHLSGVIVAGGATAGIVARDVLDVVALHQVTHLSDGVAAGLAEDSAGRLIPLVTKAGNWGETEIFLRAIHWLQKTHLRRNIETRSELNV